MNFLAEQFALIAASMGKFSLLPVHVKKRKGKCFQKVVEVTGFG